MNLESQFQADNKRRNEDHKWFEGCFKKETRRTKDLTGFILWK